MSNALFGSALIVTLVAGALSLVPLIQSNYWWIRVLDIARLHLLLVLIVASAALLYSPRRPLAWAVLALALPAMLYNAFYLIPYLPFRQEAGAVASECPKESRMRVLVANVNGRLESADELLRIVRGYDPDLFLAVETNQWWDEQLAALKPRFTDAVQQVAGSRANFGIHLFTNFPLVESEILFPVDNRVPAIRARLSMRDGETVSFYGLHPRPPRPFHSSATRDAQLMLAAKAARESAEAMVVAGDFNAVPWEPVFRRTLRIGGLYDPRLGRGYLATYNAQMPIFYWPIDHVLITEELGILGFARGPAFGSDHWPVVADLCRRPGLARARVAPPLEPDDLEAAESAIRSATSNAD
ncbi:endonuclease/exonuclease/phosphatase family protein [Sinorhizobium sojae]|uniref:endonuclease/exonuclease/phosphatase family protein n=1 Tax=Sinorhizobium sojae TaxID=716925 RepID=UPI00055851A0|nr:endonuclease/exonuclease/phosphatase family protein [Sinorhizobium sojae]